MKNKSLAFCKNAAITIGATLASGAAASEIAGSLTENGKIIGAASTITEYITSWAVFLPLQAYDNRDVYRSEEGKFDRKRFLIDNLKFGLGLTALDIGYVITRPFIQERFIDSGINPARSSLVTDGIFIPAYIAAAVGLARLAGVIKPQSKLENKIDECSGE